MTTLAVLDPKIPEVLDLETGIHLSLADVVGSDRDKISHRRLAMMTGLKTNRPLYACSMCGVAVGLLMHPESRHFYFKHTLEDGRCPAITRGELSREEINALKYNGAKESWRHAKIKNLVAESLRADPRFSNVKVEKRWVAPLTGAHRQPDVQATYGNHEGYAGVRVAFEIQLSTTYLDVIAERRLFYLKEGGLLFWIFAEFNDTDRRLMQDDIFFNNNQNAFLVSDETAARSVSLGEFHLSCVWAEPTSSTTVSTLHRKTVSFHDLKLDTAKQQAFYFDFYGAEETFRQQKLAAAAQLRENFEAVWTASESGEADIGNIWGKFYREFRAIGVPLPFYPRDLHPILANALYSAKHGRVIGWRYKTFIEVAHKVASGHKSYLQLFRHALGVYGRGKQIEREDKTGKWKARVAQYKKAIRDGDPSYEPDTTHYEVLAFLFPELFVEQAL